MVRASTFLGFGVVARALCVTVVLGVVPGAGAAPPETLLVSVPVDENDVNADCFYSAVSADGAFVAYATDATNLFLGDTNGARDVLVYGVDSGTVVLTSQSTAGELGNGESDMPAISADGGFVVFASDAYNLLGWIDQPLDIPVDSNGTTDVFIHDRVGGTTDVVSVNTDEVQGDGPSTLPSISADGTRVAFVSESTNLDVADGDTNGVVADAFVRDLTTGETTLVSKDAAGVQGTSPVTYAAISGNGQFVVFSTLAAMIPADDTNGKSDIYLKDLASGSLTLVSRRPDGKASDGTSLNPAIDSTGTHVTFDSNATNMLAAGVTNLRRVYVFDTTTSTMSVASNVATGTQGVDSSDLPSISPDGRYVAFSSKTAKLVPTDSNGFKDVFLHDLQTGSDLLVSVSSTNLQGNADSDSVLFSCAQGSTVVAFRSRATNLVSGTPTANRARVYVRKLPDDRTPPVITCPANITTECTGDGGALVDFEVTATDDTDPAPVVVATPVPGSLFVLGTTAVQATATDASGNVSSCQFTVTVADTAAPTITCPGPIDVFCTSTEGAVVEFTVTATDACDPSPSVVSDPPSGSLFPRGVTRVTSTATDSSGLTDTCQFDVSVTPELRIFLRGDANSDSKVATSDAVFLLRHLFAGGTEPPCLDAADADDNGIVNLSDAIYLFDFLFRNGSPIPPPGNREAGPDPTDDVLGCGAPSC